MLIQRHRGLKTCHESYRKYLSDESSDITDLSGLRLQAVQEAIGTAAAADVKGKG